MDFAGIFIYLVFAIPLLGLSIWGLKDPEEYYDYFSGWRYDTPPDISEFSRDMIRLQSVVVIIMTILVFYSSFIK